MNNDYWIRKVEWQHKEIERYKKELLEAKEQYEWLEKTTARWMNDCLEQTKLANRYKGEVEELGERLDRYEG
jgi:hypothetical protein